MKRLRGKLCLVGLGVVAALSLFATPASASLHPYLGVAADGQPPPAPGLPNLPLETACGLAVDSKGQLFVSEYERGVIDIFGPPGFISNFPGAGAENAACGLAVDSLGRIYANRYHGEVVRYDSFVLAAEIDPDRATGIAVESTSDLLYVTHRTHIAAYESDGTPVMDGGEPLQVGLGSLGDAYGLAVSGFADTKGHLYVADATDETVKVFDPATDAVNPLLEIDGSEVPLGEFRDLGDATLAVDDLTGHLFVTDNLQPGFEDPIAAVYEFDEAGNYLGQLQNGIVDIVPSGLAVDNSGLDNQGKIYVASGNEVVFNIPAKRYEGSLVHVFCATGACVSPPAEVLEIDKSGSGNGSVKASAGEIDCGTICAWEYDQDAEVTLTATPRPHSAFTGWSVNGSASICPGIGTCAVPIGGPTEVTANFTAIPQKALTVSGSGSGQGTVTSSPAGIECGAICIAGFDQGSTVTLTAEAAVGSEFTGWSGAGCSGTSACKVPMGSEQAVSAQFRSIPRIPPVDKDSGRRTLAISVTGEGAGTITSDPGGIECGTPCSSAYAPGTKVTLTAKPDEESAFSGWSGCDSSKGTICTVTLSSSKTVGASFAEATPLEIAGVSLNGAKATLSVAVPGKGTLSAKAKQLKPVSAKARKAETLSLPLTLNKAAKKALAKKGTLKVKVALTFKPTGAGAPRELEKTITFRKKAARKAGKK